jgi:hypothetical protein
MTQNRHKREYSLRCTAPSSSNDMLDCGRAPRATQ